MSQVERLHRNLTSVMQYTIECAWCGRISDEEDTSPDAATAIFYKEGWRYAADASQEGIACPGCMKEAEERAAEIIRECD